MLAKSRIFSRDEHRSQHPTVQDIAEGENDLRNVCQHGIKYWATFLVTFVITR